MNSGGGSAAAEQKAGSDLAPPVYSDVVLNLLASPQDESLRGHLTARTWFSVWMKQARSNRKQ